MRIFKAVFCAILVMLIPIGVAFVAQDLDKEMIAAVLCLFFNACCFGYLVWMFYGFFSKDNSND